MDWSSWTDVLAVSTFLGGLAALWFFWDKLVAMFSSKPTVSEHDEELYEKYKVLFVENGVADFYGQHDFLASFREAEWHPLSEYVDNWHTVDHEFVDRELQRKHKKVYEAAKNIGTAIATYTVPIGNGSIRSVKPDYVHGPTPERIKSEAKEINALRPAFIKAHQEFIRLANRKLRKRVS